jgi:glycosyltransferase involved in cell wall biosynthesis
MTDADLSALAARITAAGWPLYYDVSPMFDEHWTGIPYVAAGLCDALLTLLPDNTQFFYRHDLVAPEAVRDALARESGLYLERNFFQGHARIGPVPLPTGRIPTAGIYPSVKLANALFSVECSLYHDISTLILPQYHRIENVRHHLSGLAEDIRTNAVTFAVSRAPADDLVCYLDAPPERVAVAGNGVSWPWWFPIHLANEPPETDEPYLVVLGTREPRKNLARLFEALTLFPNILARSRLLVVGKAGWLTESQSVPLLVQDMIARGRIVLTGYVSGYEKYRLLARAQATIYPSLFEGFGLPVLESLSLGTPCIASWSSAIPEVGGHACFYFDPLSAEELGLTILRVQDVVPKHDADYVARCRVTASGFTWTGMLGGVLERLVGALSGASA